ncbi:MAG: hypothetical protein ACEY3M_17065 [Wolbachia sp.]
MLLFLSSQCLGTGMTASLTTVIPLLVSGRDTANESRYDGSRQYDVELTLAILLCLQT